MTILIPVIVMLVIAAVCAILLVVASTFFAVEEDETALKLRDVLPGANCGSCGYSGCDAYAKALSEGKATKTNLCTPGGDGVARDLAEILGVEAEGVVEQVAYVACGGLNCAEKKKFEYTGPASCRAASMQFAGDNVCAYACLGYGDCAAVCPRDAITVNERGIADIDPRKCIGCGLCVRTCPKGIIHLIKDTERIVVKCSNHDKGAKVMKICDVGCIACGKCQRSCPTGAIRVVDNLAQIDYDKCTACGICRSVCPKHCIYEGSFVCGAHFE